MNKFITLLATLLLATQALLLAQPTESLAVGGGFGTNGASIEVASAFGPHFTLRAGYSYAPAVPFIKVTDVSVPVHPGASTSEYVKVPAYGGPGWNNGHVLLNYYPSERIGIYIAAGLFAGARTYLTARAASLPTDYNTIGVQVRDGYTIKATNYAINGRILGNVIKPYLGVGLGRPATLLRPVTVSFDLGACYVGSPKIGVTGTGLTDTKKLELEARDFGQYAADYAKYSKWAMFYPIIQLHVYYNIF